MLRRKLLFGFAALSLLALGQSAQAGFSNFVGGLPVSFGAITTDTGNVNTATSFTITPAVYLGGAGGDFATYVPTYFTNFTPLATSITMTGLNPNATVGSTVSPYSSLSFSSSSFGSFVASSYVVLASSNLTQSYEFFGTYTTGTYFASDPNAGSGPASFTVTFAQTVAGGAISGSGVLNVPPSPVVPEPASVAMLGMGLVAVGGLALRRRSAK